MARKSTTIEPIRSEQLVARVTVAVRRRVERVSEHFNWSLSKTTYLCIVKGLDSIEPSSVADNE